MYVDLFVGTYRLSSHARLEAFVIQTKLNYLAYIYIHLDRIYGDFPAQDTVNTPYTYGSVIPCKSLLQI